MIIDHKSRVQYYPDIVVMLLYGCYGWRFPVTIGLYLNINTTFDKIILIFHCENRLEEAWRKYSYLSLGFSILGIRKFPRKKEEDACNCEVCQDVYFVEMLLVTVDLVRWLQWWATLDIVTAHQLTPHTSHNTKFPNLRVITDIRPDCDRWCLVSAYPGTWSPRGSDDDGAESWAILSWWLPRNDRIWSGPRLCWAELRERWF